MLSLWVINSVLGPKSASLIFSSLASGPCGQRPSGGSTTQWTPTTRKCCGPPSQKCGHSPVDNQTCPLCSHAPWGSTLPRCQSPCITLQYLGDLRPSHSEHLKESRRSPVDYNDFHSHLCSSQNVPSQPHLCKGSLASGCSGAHSGQHNPPLKLSFMAWAKAIEDGTMREEL